MARKPHVTHCHDVGALLPGKECNLVTKHISIVLGHFGNKPLNYTNICFIQIIKNMTSVLIGFHCTIFPRTHKPWNLLASVGVMD